jgi:hypothetical protein
MGNLRIGPYFAFLSKFWVVGHVITRSRTASGYVDGADDLLRSGLGRRARGLTSELPYCVQLVQALGPTLSLSLRPRQCVLTVPQLPNRLGHDGPSSAFASYLMAVVATKLFDHWRGPPVAGLREASAGELCSLMLPRWANVKAILA